MVWASGSARPVQASASRSNPAASARRKGFTCEVIVLVFRPTVEEKLLTLINRDWTSPALDGLMAVMSSINFWAVPLILLVIAIAVRGGFRARAMLVVLAVTVLISDSGVGNGLKHLIRRPRPNEVVAGVRIVSLNLHHPLPRLLALFKN